MLRNACLQRARFCYQGRLNRCNTTDRKHRSNPFLGKGVRSPERGNKENTSNVPSPRDDEEPIILVPAHAASVLTRERDARDESKCWGPSGAKASEEDDKNRATGEGAQTVSLQGRGSATEVCTFLAVLLNPSARDEARGRAAQHNTTQHNTQSYVSLSAQHSALHKYKETRETAPTVCAQVWSLFG